MGKSKSGKSKVKAAAGGNFTDIIDKTVKEMILDLSKVDAAKSLALQKIVKGLGKEGVIAALKDEESELYKSIPKDVLELDKGGRAYLKIMSVVQPSLAPCPEPEPATTVIRKPVEKREKDIPSGLGDADMMRDMLKNMEGGEDLQKLAEDVMQHLNIANMDPENLGPADMMSMFSNIQSYVTEKLESGELDVSKLETGARKFCDTMKDSDEFKEALAANPELSSLL